MEKYTESSGIYAFSSIADDRIDLSSTSPFLENAIVHEIEIGNSSGGDASCGWGIELLSAEWKAGQWDNSEDPAYVDDTTDAQDSGTDDFALTTTTNNDGYVVQAREPFNIVGIDVSTAEAGSPTYEYTFWDGSAWTTLPTLAVPDYTGTGVEFLTFLKPNTWAALASGDTPVDTEGLTAGYYAIRCRATTAPSTAPLATDLWVVKLLDYVETVGDGNSIVKEYRSGKAILAGRNIVPYCSTANAANWIQFEYRRSS